MTTAITDAFTHDHRACDHLLAAAESAVGTGGWSAIGRASEALIAAVERHFRAEEAALFPALAKVFLIAAHPIEILCGEHAQIRRLLEDLRAAVATCDREAVLGILETLNLLVQQHNYKEEAVIYPMADGALRERASDMAALVGPTAR
ncbi:hemerythrin domain-containing protein [Thiohalocapsa marina]|uniref:Hemerythrin domain-containing protein n=1 Tax=Thiohalocapsa marina TaxID=424902 RepID=A0A5M8FVM5_9GAMM|nr:hemerythrin domain-containing protein [Thiohalocapsa marina]KAA6187813.1 hemerythrin domain-containing protein [Thiohalocapsa marina]